MDSRILMTVSWYWNAASNCTDVSILAYLLAVSRFFSKARIAEMEAEKAAYKAEPVVEEETIGVKVCPVCGAVSEDKFCPHCGAPMGD